MTEPTRLGRSVTNPAASTTSIIMDPSSSPVGTAIATGNWMVVFIAMTVTTTTMTPPAGWTQIMAPTLTGTEYSGAWARIRQAGDTSYTWALNAAGTTGGGVIAWGDLADPTISNWIIGTKTTRATSGGTFTNWAETITTTTADTLSLIMSTERTSAATGGVPTYSGGTSWFQMAESGGQIQTIDFGYIDMPTPGATGRATLTYGATQTANGIALQLGIPPVPFTGGPASLSATATLTPAGTPGPAATDALNATATLSATGTPANNGAGTGTLGATASLSATTPAVGVLLSMGATASLSASALTPVTSWIASQPLDVMHRNAELDWPEQTLYGYTQAANWSARSALEISAQQSSDGVWVASHDQTTGRVYSGTSLDIPTNTWATLSTKTTIIGGYPIARVIDILDAFPTRIFFVDNKNTVNISNFLDMLDAHGGPSHIIVKGFSGSTGYADLATARGYSTWGYFYHADTANISSRQSHWTLLGEGIDGENSADWTAILAVGKPVIAHTTITSSTTRATAAAFGANGFMNSKAVGVVPQTPALGSLSAAATLTATGGQTGAGSAALTATATLSATTKAGAIAATTLSAAASLNVSTSQGVTGAASLTAAATLSASGAGGSNGSGAASLGATAQLTSIGSPQPVGIAALTAAAVLTVSAKVGVIAALVMNAFSTLTAIGGAGTPVHLTYRGSSSSTWAGVSSAIQPTATSTTLWKGTSGE